MALSTMPVIEARGSAREIGRQTGEQTRDNVARLIDRMYHYRAWPTDKSDPLWVRRLPTSLAVIRRDLPHIYEEFVGLAEGANQPLDMIAMINLAFFGNELDDNCTNIGFANGPDGPIWGKNNDGMTPDDGMPIALRKVYPDHGIPFMAFIFTGWIGFGDGMNAEGLAMGHSSVGSRFQQSDTFMKVRMWAHHGLMTCRTTREFVSHMASRPLRGKGYSWIVVDKTGDALSLEAAVPLAQIRRGNHPEGHVHCVNCYQLPHLADADRRPPDQKCQAIERWQMLDGHLAEEGPFDVERMKRLLRYHGNPGVCRHGAHDRAHTNYSAIALPASGKLLHYLGYPCQGEYGELTL